MSVARCPNHPYWSRDYRVVAPVEVRPDVFMCHPCAAKERVLALNIAALPTRELGKRSLVKLVRP